MRSKLEQAHTDARIFRDPVEGSHRAHRNLKAAPPSPLH